VSQNAVVADQVCLQQPFELSMTIMVGPMQELASVPLTKKVVKASAATERKV